MNKAPLTIECFEGINTIWIKERGKNSLLLIIGMSEQGFLAGNKFISWEDAMEQYDWSSDLKNWKLFYKETNQRYSLLNMGSYWIKDQEMNNPIVTSLDKRTAQKVIDIMNEYEYSLKEEIRKKVKQIEEEEMK